MSDYNWCHGPKCHEHKTQDRIRGVKGSKVLRTRKIAINKWNESSSMALSVYSPENLASLLEDKEVLTREQKIAFARQQLAQQSVN